MPERFNQFWTDSFCEHGSEPLYFIAGTLIANMSPVTIQE
jgi:hypothetical protein